MSVNSQISIFDVIKNNRFEELLSKVNDYGIDEIYRTEFKGKGELLSVIQAKLESNENYKEYKESILKILNDFYKDNELVDVVYYTDYDYIRIFSDLSRSSYPVYCLEMINEKDR